MICVLVLSHSRQLFIAENPLNSTYITGSDLLDIMEHLAASDAKMFHTFWGHKQRTALEPGANANP